MRLTPPPPPQHAPERPRASESLVAVAMRTEKQQECNAEAEYFNNGRRELPFRVISAADHRFSALNPARLRQSLTQSPFPERRT